MEKSRLRQIRDKFAQTASEFAQMTGLEIRTYSGYERGERKPPVEYLATLAQKFNINLHWYITGNGSMFLPAPENTKLAEELAKRTTFGKRLNFYQSEKNLSDSEIAKILNVSENRVEILGLDEAEPTLTELKALKSYSGIAIDVWVDGGQLNQCNIQNLTSEEQKMLEFLKKAKKENLI